MRNTLSICMISIILAGCAGGRVSGCGYREMVGKSLYQVDLDAIRATGKEIRLLYPDSYLGFEKKENRINIIRDENAEILAVTCG